MKSKVNNEEFIVIQGWMINELNLKGTDLLVYAIIYRFSSKEEDQVFKGGIQYLADWTNATSRTIITCLHGLVDRGLIGKIEYVANGVKKFHYYVKKFQWGSEKISLPSEKISHREEKENRNENNIYLEKEIYKEKETTSISSLVEEIVSYLNSKTGANYRSTTPKTISCIRARLNEGFTIEDFKKVIDIKYSSWGKDEKMKIFLRPETLFGNKFEGYLNECSIILKPNQPLKRNGEEKWGDDVIVKNRKGLWE